MTATLGSTGVEDTLLWWIRPASVSSAISVKVPPISTAIRIRFPSTEFVPAYATNCLVNNSLMAGSCQADSFGSIGCRLGQSGPVSYTHLRAHETRHELVCRLLLAKKKKYYLLYTSPSPLEELKYRKQYSTNK